MYTRRQKRNINTYLYIYVYTKKETNRKVHTEKVQGSGNDRKDYIENQDHKEKQKRQMILCEHLYIYTSNKPHIHIHITINKTQKNLRI